MKTNKTIFIIIAVITTHLIAFNVGQNKGNVLGSISGVIKYQNKHTARAMKLAKDRMESRKDFLAHQTKTERYNNFAYKTLIGLSEGLFGMAHHAVDLGKLVLDKE